MARDITTALQTKLDSNRVFVADLIEIHLPTTLYFTTTNVNLLFNSDSAPDSGDNTYIAQNQFLGYGEIQESSDLRVGSLQITFTAVDPTMVAVILSNDYINRRVVIYRAILQDDLSFTSDDVYLMFDGYISGYSIEETGSTATIVLTCASQFADFERTNGRRTNPASQNLYFANDRGMDFSPQIVKDIRWGKL